MKKSKKKVNKLAVFFVVAITEMVIVTGFVAYKGYLIGRYSKTLHKETQILKEKTELAEVSNDLEIQKKLKIAALEKDKNLIFDDESLMSFLKNLYDTASAYNLTIVSISFSKLQDVANTNQPIKILPVNLSVIGKNYNDVVNFLAFLERKGYSLKPDTISVSEISSLSSAKVKSQVDISVSFIIYLQTKSKAEWSYKSGG